MSSESFLNDGSSLLSIGTFKLSELTGAYEKADPAAGGGSMYDVLTNNCSNFAVDLASQLGIEIDGHIKSFVTRHLLEESGIWLAAKIRNHWDYFSLFSSVGGDASFY